MEKTFFAGPSHVEIQGDQVLSFISVNDQVAVYQLLGFEENPVIIQDYRDFGLNAINTLIKDGRLDDFAPKFNKPSYVSITESADSILIINLHETADLNPPYMLWIAIGMEEEPPNYSYVFREIVPFQQNKLAILSLYKRPYRRSIINQAVPSLCRISAFQIQENVPLKQ